MKAKVFIVFIILFLGISLNYLYQVLVITRSPEEFYRQIKTERLKDNKIRTNFKLISDAHLLKIKHIIQNDQTKEIFFNGIKVGSDSHDYVKRKGIIETTYLYLPKELVKRGRNTLQINFPKNHPPDIDIMLSNYRKIERGVYILFPDSAQLPVGNIPFKNSFLIASLLFLSFAGIVYLLRKVFYLDISSLFFYQIYSLLPSIVFLAALAGYNSLLFYKVAFVPRYFRNIVLVNFILTGLCIISMKIWKSHASYGHIFRNKRIDGFAYAAVGWTKSKEFCDKCILVFMALFSGCALLLAMHLRSIAEGLAELAFFILLTGVATKFVGFLREEGRID